MNDCAPPSSDNSPRILYVLTSLEYFLSHRLPMAEAAQHAGFEVHVAAHCHGVPDDFCDRGFTFHSLPHHRGRTSPSVLFKTLWALFKLLRFVRADVVHAVAMQSCLMVLALKLLWPFLPSRILAAYTGMGTLFSAERLAFRHRVLRRIALLVLLTAHRFPSCYALVQNSDDHAFLRQLGVPQQRLFLIPGSGVDCQTLVALPFPPPFPDGDVHFGYVGRMLIDKGVRELVQAFLLLQKRYPRVHLHLAGLPDPQNAKTLSDEDMAGFDGHTHIHWHHHVTDISEFWARCHVAVLASRREGMPKSLLEAAACGRALLATDVPGCRDLVHDGVNGFKVPLSDIQALCDRMSQYVTSRVLISEHGRAARYDAETLYSSSVIQGKIGTLYRQLIET